MIRQTRSSQFLSGRERKQAQLRLEPNRFCFDWRREGRTGSPCQRNNVNTATCSILPLKSTKSTGQEYLHLIGSPTGTAVGPKTVEANESWMLTTYVKATFAAAAASVSVINSAACDRLISEDAVKEHLCWRGKNAVFGI